MPWRMVVLDTNVLVAGLKSRRGASFELLRRLGSREFDISVSVPLLFEYEDVLARTSLSLSADAARVVLDYLCRVARHQEIHSLWRPTLKDPKDDLVLEVAVASRSTAIITFNTRDFEGIERFGIEAMQPGAFLMKLGEKP